MKTILTRVLIAILAATLLMAGAGEKGDYENTLTKPFEIYQAGKKALQEGRYGAAIRSLEAAAKRGVVDAQMDLARLFSEGKVVPADHKRALEYYEQIAQRFQDFDYLLPAKSLIAEAFVKASDYYIKGVPGSNIAPRPEYGLSMLSHAASFFQDPVAQYKLAELYLNGIVVAKNTELGLNWLANAAEKRYAPALALMGDYLWKGEGVPRAPANALAHLAMAVQSPPPEDRTWIDALYLSTLAAADARTVETANRILAKVGVEFRIDPKRDLIDTRPGQQIAAPNGETVIGGEAKTSGEDRRPDAAGTSPAQERTGVPARGFAIDAAPAQGR